MLRKIGVALPLLFVFVVAFSLVVTMYSTAAADPPTGCCWFCKNCPGPGGPGTTELCGWGEFIQGQGCIETLWSWQNCGGGPGECDIT